jgi:hypothetical protein
VYWVTFVVKPALSAIFASVRLSTPLIGRLGARLVLAQHRDDLLFREPLPLHLTVPSIRAGL